MLLPVSQTRTHIIVICLVFLSPVLTKKQENDLKNTYNHYLPPWPQIGVTEPHSHVQVCSHLLH